MLSRFAPNASSLGIIVSCAPSSAERIKTLPDLIFSLVTGRTNCLSLKIPGNELYEYQYFEFFKGYDSPRVLKGKSLTAILDIE